MNLRHCEGRSSLNVQQSTTKKNLYNNFNIYCSLICQMQIPAFAGMTLTTHLLCIKIDAIAAMKNCSTRE